MVEVKSKLGIRREAFRLEVKGGLELPFDARQKSRLRARLVSGEEVSLMLPRGEILRGGDLVVASDGRVIEVIAEPESVLHVECATPAALAKAAYHLGNRHVPLQVGAAWLRIAADHVLAGMLKGLGATVTPVQTPFEPEAGAYPGGHHHDAADEPGARIHEYGDHGDRNHHNHDHDDHHPYRRPPVTKGATGLARLLQLASPTLPVGAYSYSQGLEAAIEAGIVRDAASANRWITDVLVYSVASMDAPVLLRFCAAWRAGDPTVAADWNALFLAARETAELRAETAQMGYSLAKLLAELGVGEVPLEEPSFPAAFAFAAAAWRIEPHETLVVYLWSWIENQVLAAVKAVPLGQTEGQHMLLELGERIEAIADRASALRDEELGNFAPGFALLSSRHETQYSRLFRS